MIKDGLFRPDRRPAGAQSLAPLAQETPPLLSIEDTTETYCQNDGMTEIFCYMKFEFVWDHARTDYVAGKTVYAMKIQAESSVLKKIKISLKRPRTNGLK